MQSGPARVAVVIAAIAAVVVLFIVLSSGDDDESTTTATTTQSAGDGGKPDSSVPTIEIKDGQPVGGVQDLEFSSGDQIRFEVSSDEDWEIHFHGYNVMMDVTPEKPVTFDVPADIEGIFEVEIEDTATQIAEITVNP